MPIDLTDYLRGDEMANLIIGIQFGLLIMVVIRYYYKRWYNVR